MLPEDLTVMTRDRVQSLTKLHGSLYIVFRYGMP